MPLFNKVKDYFQKGYSSKKKKVYHHVLFDNPEEKWLELGELGDGAFGKVYKTQNKIDGTLAALKLVPLEEEEDIDDFMIEIEILSDCNHINIIQLIEAYQYDGKLWMYLEYCDGGAVDSIMVDLDRPLNEKQIAYICKEILEALKYLHSNKIIHRDLKAGNILLTMEGGVKLADFNVSAKNKSTLDKRGTFIGTPYWLAPEVILCETFIDANYDYKADIWSLGITLIELAEMDPPNHEVSPVRVMLKIQKSEAPKLKYPSRFSRKFNDFLTKCLIKIPEHRMNATELLQHPFVTQAMDVKPVKDLLLEYKAEVVVEDIDSDAEDLSEDSKSSKGPAPLPPSTTKKGPAPQIPITTNKVAKTDTPQDSQSLPKVNSVAINNKTEAKPKDTPITKDSTVVNKAVSDKKETVSSSTSPSNDKNKDKSIPSSVPCKQPNKDSVIEQKEVKEEVSSKEQKISKKPVAEVIPNKSEDVLPKENNKTINQESKPNIDVKSNVNKSMVDISPTETKSPLVISPKALIDVSPIENKSLIEVSPNENASSIEVSPKEKSTIDVTTNEDKSIVEDLKEEKAIVVPVEKSEKKEENVHEDTLKPTTDTQESKDSKNISTDLSTKESTLINISHNLEDTIQGNIYVGPAVSEAEQNKSADSQQESSQSYTTEVTPVTCTVLPAESEDKTATAPETPEVSEETVDGVPVSDVADKTSVSIPELPYDSKSTNSLDRIHKLDDSEVVVTNSSILQENSSDITLPSVEDSSECASTTSETVNENISIIAVKETDNEDYVECKSPLTEIGFELPIKDDSTPTIKYIEPDASSDTSKYDSSNETASTADLSYYDSKNNSLLRPDSAATVSIGSNTKKEPSENSVVEIRKSSAYEQERAKKTKEEQEIQAYRKKTRKRTRKFEIDGVVVTTTTSKVIYEDEDNPNMASAHLARKLELREIKILQKQEQKGFQELSAKAEAVKYEQERKFDNEMSNLIRHYDGNIESLNRQHKQQVERLETKQEVELKSASKKIRVEQEKELKSFKESLKQEMRLLKQEIECLPKDKRKEHFKLGKERLDQTQAQREKLYVEKLNENHEISLKRLNDSHRAHIAMKERQFLEEKHQLMRARENAVWETEERHLHDKYQLAKEQLKDVYYLQRHQMLIRHNKELEQVRRMNNQKEEQMLKRQAAERKELPKRIRQEMKTREKMFKEKLRISMTTLPSQDGEKEQFRKFQEQEKIKYDAEKQRAERKFQKQLEELRASTYNSVKELEILQNEKCKLLMEHETSKLKALDEDYQNELKAWKANLKSRKQALEDGFDKQLSEQDRFYGDYLNKRMTTPTPSVSSLAESSIS